MEQTFKIVHGAIRLPRPASEKLDSAGRSAPRFLTVGDVIRGSEWPESDIRAWLADGFIRPAGVVSVTRTPRGHDPASLATKSLEDLLTMVNEIDEDEAAEIAESDSPATLAIAYLSAEYRPTGGTPLTPLPSEGDLRSRAKGR
jgi:hypothetical protein